MNNSVEKCAMQLFRAKMAMPEYKEYQDSEELQISLFKDCMNQCLPL